MSESISKEALLEAILFWKGEPMTFKSLAKASGIALEELSARLDSLEAALSERGLTLVRKDDAVVLGTNEAAASRLEELSKEELSKDIGRAGLEVLSLVLYLFPIAKSRIDHVRGVSSDFTIRNLVVRGLIERVENEGVRGYSYAPTLDLLAFLGIKRIEDLPEYEKVRSEILKKEAQLANFEKEA